MLVKNKIKIKEFTPSVLLGGRGTGEDAGGGGVKIPVKNFHLACCESYDIMAL